MLHIRFNHEVKSYPFCMNKVFAKTFVFIMYDSEFSPFLIG